MMSPTPMQELINLRWYIQHLIHGSGYLYDDDESSYPLSEDKWMLQTHGKFMKYVFYTLHRMPPDQMKMNPIKPIIKDCRILRLTTLNSLLQYVNWLVWEICSVN